jgi:Protein of unknown function (DUF3037)
MRENQGYYSLIQYSEFPERVEYVNIGVCLFSASMPQILIKFSESPKRVEHAFGIDLGVHYNLMKDAISSRIKNEFGNFWDKRSLDRFIELRSGKVRLSRAFSVYVSSPSDTLSELFESLVIEKPTQIRRERIKTRLKRELQFQNVEELLEQPDPVVLPQGPTIRAPYAYQNGSYNLICPVSLRDSPDVAIREAGKYALEGHWLYESSREVAGSIAKKLVIVGDLTGQNDDFSAAVQDVMKRSNIGFYPIADLTPLADDIRRNIALHGEKTLRVQ